MNRVDVVDLVVDLDDQKYGFCSSWTDLNIVDGLNRNTCTNQSGTVALICRMNRVDVVDLVVDFVDVDLDVDLVDVDLEVDLVDVD